MRLRVEQLEHEKEAWLASQQQLQQFQQYVEDLVLEKEEMLRSHTLETAELRKKNAALVGQAQKLESISMSAVPSSTGYSTDFSEFDHLTMESSPWDNFSMVNDFSMETDPKQENSLVVLPKKERASSKDEDKTATSGLLLMLLLCGAWVASSNTPAAPVSVPTMPEDIGVASAAVLDTLYKDAGVSPVQPLDRQNANVKRHSSTQSVSNTALGTSGYASLSHSPLATLHHHLVNPSEQRQREQTFSVSTNQYNRVPPDELFNEPILPLPSRRRNLGEALAAMRQEKQGSAAEMYTRSLMWDEIPANVVRDFARMVAECKSPTARPENREPIS